MKNKNVNWAGRINDIHPGLIDHPEITMKTEAMQLHLLGVLIDQMNNHALFSSILHTPGTRQYRIAIRKSAYQKTGIDVLKINFNRYNISLRLMDDSGDQGYGLFRFKTIPCKDTEGTFTGQLHYNTEDDEKLINELTTIFYETEVIFATTEDGYYEFDDEDEVDLGEIKFVDLCTKYCGNIILTGKLIRAGYGTLSAYEFYKTVNLDELAELPSIGEKSISVINQIYKFYNFEGYKEK
jgi:hypothetical protein